MWRKFAEPAWVSLEDNTPLRMKVKWPQSDKSELQYKVKNLQQAVDDPVNWLEPKSAFAD